NIFLFAIFYFTFYFCFFFFSSRRRHTRSKRDWSSDVCSSDLCLSREIHPGFFHQAELLEIIAKPLRSQSEPDLHKNRITGILHSFHECLRPVSSYFVAPDSPILYNLIRSEEHTSELQSRFDLVCRLLL